VAGAARSLLRGSAKETAALTALFGGDPDRAQGTEYSSALSTYDARWETPELLSTVRDGVRIDPSKGIAMSGCKYDLEVLPAGTRFQLRLKLTLFDKPPHAVVNEDLKALFRAILVGFCGGEIRIGARTSRGFGRGTVKEWNIRRLGVDSRAHVAAWLSDPWDKDAGDAVALAGPNALPACDAAWRVPSLKINATLRLKTSLLNRSGGSAPREPDMVHLTENDRALLTGTSLAGAVRARCRRIAATMLSPAAADPLVAGMFGPLHDPDKPPSAQEKLRASRVRVEESAVKDARLMVQGRVAIDRFTSGSLDSALFDEAPAFPGENGSDAEVEFTLRDPQSRETALLLLAFKDLWLGDLALNGEVSVGRGVFTGVSATIQHPEFGKLGMESDPADPAEVQLTEEPAGGWSRLDQQIQNWRGNHDTQE
jgi:hypothetical protein